MAKSKIKFCPFNHYVAILYRRLIMYKRAGRSLLTTLVGLILFSVLGILVQHLMILLMKPKFHPVTFDTYNQVKDDIVFSGLYNQQYSKNVIEQLKKDFKKDTGVESHVEYFSNINNMNQELYKRQVEGNYNMEIPFGVDFKKVDSPPYLVTLVFNQTTNAELESSSLIQSNAHILYGNALWRLEFQTTKSIEIGFMAMQQKMAQMLFSMLGPMLIVCGMMTIISLVITQPVADINGEARQYMVQCGLKITPYWLATFTIDVIVWIILATVVWAVYCIGQVQSILDNLFNTWYLLLFTGPSFILFLYDFSFLFKDSNSAARQTFLILVCLVLLPMVIQVIVGNNSNGMNWFYSFLPHISMMQALGTILMNGGSRKQNLSYYWKLDSTFPFLIMQYIDILIFGFILWLIEFCRKKVQRKLAKRSYSTYTDFLRSLKEKHRNSEETLQMEEEVHNSHDFAVRVENVSRLFINTAGEPIPAVNCVTLGVKDGSIFGFLGANGAGKTTLIRMITGSLPVSDGSIEIFGTPIEELKNTTVLSICPQFNTHLCFEMTPREHFKLFGLLFEMEEDESKDVGSKLMHDMEIDSFIDKPIRDLSAGDVRKLAIALTFFGPSKIILLDEPTASLDPVACRCVQDMILENREEKTFMLCTHLLSEAEELCDMISIMVKGNVFTVGSPQYLTKKFGTEYKIDVMLKDESEETAFGVDEFFVKKLPEAKLSMKRPKSRIYSVPADSITLAELFERMQDGQDSDCGITYYTCSGSSLERVFMEIVQISEMENNEANEKVESLPTLKTESVGMRRKSDASYQQLDKGQKKRRKSFTKIANDDDADTSDPEIMRDSDSEI